MGKDLYFDVDFILFVKKTKPTAMSTRILIADDNDVVQQAIRFLVSKEDDMEVAGQAWDGQSTVELAAQLQPDVVVIDVAIPNSNGIEAARRIVRDQPGVKIVALSRRRDQWSVRKILEAGAVGYVAKDCTFEELIGAIRAVINNQTYISPCIVATADEGQRVSKSTHGDDETTTTEKTLSEFVGD
jgi:DNA-binding NarL/FixJ family response regulator